MQAVVTLQSGQRELLVCLWKSKAETVLIGCVGQLASGAPVWGLAEPAGQGRPQSALQAHSFPLIFDSYALQQVIQQILH